MRAALAGVLLLVAAGFTAAVTTRSSVSAGPHSPAPAETGDGRLVLVSGRDDHGLPASERVTLRSQPAADARAAGEVPDGTLARVLAVRGTWLQVRTAEGANVQGWVDDFYLRGVVHLVGSAPTCQVPLGGEVLPDGEQAVVLDLRGTQAWVRVTRTGATGLVARSAVREIVPERCGQPEAPEAADGHHHHDG
jgi:hypothetical protein